MKTVEIECPQCQAEPSEACRTAGGRTLSRPHSDRVFAAERINIATFNLKAGLPGGSS